MRELGRVGGKARRRGLGERPPESERVSLVEALRNRLDVELVVGAVEQSLKGGNESARVAAVKFLADLEIYRREDEHENAPDVDIEAKLLALLARGDGDREGKRRQEIEQAVRERTVELTRERDEALARLAEFESVSS